MTIADMSQALGLTKSTVSRALNGYPDIADATRLRVTRMAEKMGYRPLSHAQAIRTGRTKSLGLVIQLSEHDAHRPFLAEFLAGLSLGASAEGYTLTVASSTSDSDTLLAFQTMLQDRKADGFVLQRTLRDDPRIRMLRAMEVPFVLFGRTGDDHGCAWLDVDGEGAIGDAVDRLFALGHRRIGYIGGGLPYNYSALRRGGFVDAMARNGMAIDADLLREGAVTRADGAAAAAELLDTKAPPTAIVCAVDMAALGVYNAAADRGLTVGTELSVIAYDGIPEGAHMAPALSTYAVDFTDCGQRLSGFLIRRIQGEAPEKLRELTTARYLDRGSARAPVCTSAALAARIAKHHRT
ncbi:LacI family DNA-binding transcriptional regulator [Yoonia sp. R2331]|uniref:LacI family DNA-binding transcriptional regulator n=1 Tax=Yoonia sp. R2331 TaxID=3237238 RepID=UPI0034E51AC9